MKKPSDIPVINEAEYKRIEAHITLLTNQIALLEGQATTKAIDEAELKREKLAALQALLQVPSQPDSLRYFLEKYPKGCRVMQGRWSETAAIFNALRSRHRFSTTIPKNNAANHDPSAYEITFSQMPLNTPKNGYNQHMNHFHFEPFAAGATPSGYYDKKHRGLIDTYLGKLEAEIKQVEWQTDPAKVKQCAQKREKLQVVKRLQTAMSHWEIQSVITDLEQSDPHQVLNWRCKSLLYALAKYAKTKELQQDNAQTNSHTPAHFGSWTL